VEINCDSCSKAFYLVIKEKKHGNGIIETYFTCPACNKRYSSAFTNARTRKLQRQIRKLWDEIRGCGNVQLAETMRAKIDKLTEENKKIMTALKEQFASS
jgi:transposase-like protein